MDDRNLHEIQQPRPVSQQVEQNSIFTDASIVRRICAFVIDSVVIHVILLAFILSFVSTTFLAVVGGMFYDVGIVTITQEEKIISTLATVFSIIALAIELPIIFLYLFFPQWQLNKTF